MAEALLNRAAERMEDERFRAIARQISELHARMVSQHEHDVHRLRCEVDAMKRQHPRDTDESVIHLQVQGGQKIHALGETHALGPRSNTSSNEWLQLGAGETLSRQPTPSKPMAQADKEDDLQRLPPQTEEEEPSTDFPRRKQYLTNSTSNSTNEWRSEVEKEDDDGEFLLRDQWLKCDKAQKSLAGRKSRTMTSTSTDITDAVQVAHNTNMGSFLKSSSLLLAPKKLSWEAFIMHPQSRVRFIWLLLSIYFIVYDMAVVPLQAFELPDTFFLQFMTWATTVFWTFDIVFTFFVGATVDGDVVMKPKAIAKLYIRSWFIFDVFIIVPEWLLQTTGESLISSTQLLRGVRLARLVRLLRVTKLERVMNEFRARVNSNYFHLSLGICRLILCLLFLNHAFACLWYLVGTAQPDGWASRMKHNGSGLLYQYMTALHWSLTQFTSAMDVSPTNLPERSFAVVIVFLAVMMFSTFVSVMTNMMVQLQSLHQERTLQKRALRDFLRDKEISSRLTIRVKKYIDGHMAAQHKHEYQVKLLQILPKQMLMDIHVETRLPVILSHRLFSHMQDDYQQTLRHISHEALSQIPMGASDPVFNLGDPCQRMVFVENGILLYNTTQNPTACAHAPTSGTWGDSEDAVRAASFGTMHGHGILKLREGRWLSEAALWTIWHNTGDAGAGTDGDILALDITSFTRVVSIFELAHADICNYAGLFVANMNACGCSDLGLTGKAEDLAEDSWGS